MLKLENLNEGTNQHADKDLLLGAQMFRGEEGSWFSRGKELVYKLMGCVCVVVCKFSLFLKSFF